MTERVVPNKEMENIAATPASPPPATLLTVLCLCGLGGLTGAWIGFIVALNIARADFEAEFAKTGQDSGFGEGAFALLFGLPLGAGAGVVSAIPVGLVIAWLLNRHRRVSARR